MNENGKYQFPVNTFVHVIISTTVGSVHINVHVTSILVQNPGVYGGSYTIVQSGISLFIVNVRVSDCAVCQKLSVAITYREYVPFCNQVFGVMFVAFVLHVRIVSVPEMICIVYQLISAQLSHVDHIQLNSVFELDIGFQFSGEFNIGSLGHSFTIHVTLYGNAKIFHALSLIYPVQDPFSVTVNVLFPVHALFHVEFRANANSGYNEILFHVCNIIVTPHVVQLFQASQFPFMYVTVHVGHSVSILYTQVEHIHVFHAASFM